MKILVLDKTPAGVTSEQIKPHLEAELRKIWSLYESNVIREMYFRGDKPGAVFILESKDLPEARAVIDSLPFVEHGLADFELIPLVNFPHIARLFAK
jgi:hypothetical protein